MLVVVVVLVVVKLHRDLDNPAPVQRAGAPGPAVVHRRRSHRRPRLGLRRRRASPRPQSRCHGPVPSRASPRSPRAAAPRSSTWGRSSAPTAPPSAGRWSSPFLASGPCRAWGRCSRTPTVPSPTSRPSPSPQPPTRAATSPSSPASATATSRTAPAPPSSTSSSSTRRRRRSSTATTSRPAPASRRGRSPSSTSGTATCRPGRASRRRSCPASPGTRSPTGSSDPKDPVTQAVVASANELSAQICAIDGRRPVVGLHKPGRGRGGPTLGHRSHRQPLKGAGQPARRSRISLRSVSFRPPQIP